MKVNRHRWMKEIANSMGGFYWIEIKDERIEFYWIEINAEAIDFFYMNYNKCEFT
jgi:hypothetical protein